MLPLQLQLESHIPLYAQLRDQLCALVHGGDLRPGDRIPATRELATQLGVHRTTVANAYAELESQGLIRGHVGRGTFICEVPNGSKITPAPPTLNGNGNGGLRWESLFADERGEEALTRLLQPVTPDSTSFVAARPDEKLFPIAELSQCCQIVMKREGPAILQFGPSDGYPPLKSALVEMLRAEGLAIKDENLLITGGCQQALDLLAKSFLRTGDAVVIENPTYPGAISLFSNARVRCLGVPVHSGFEPGTTPGVDLAALEATLLSNRVKLMILTPDFHNPTGTTMPIAARRKLLEIAARYQVPIVEDHIYGRLHTDGEGIPSLKQLDRSNIVIQVDSFSKVSFPGLRVGWVVAPPNVIERLRIVKQTADIHTDQLAQAILAEFIRRGSLEKHVAKMRTAYARRLDALDAALKKYMPDGTRWSRPSGGMCLWLELPPGFDSSELLIHVRERGVLFAPGRYFFLQNPQPNTLRMSFSNVDEKRMVRGVAIFAEVLRQEMRKRLRGNHRMENTRVALV